MSLDDRSLRETHDSDAKNRHLLPPGKPLAPPMARSPRANPHRKAEPPAFDESLMRDSSHDRRPPRHERGAAPSEGEPPRRRNRLRWPMKDRYRPGTGLGYFGRSG